MKDRTGRKPKNGKPRATKARTKDEASALAHEEIARRAFEISKRRGGEPGHEQEDWLRAEHELREERVRTP